MKTIKRYSIQYTTEQRPVNNFLRLALTPLLVLAGMVTAVLFSAMLAALLLPVVGVGYLLWKRIKAQQIIETADVIEAEFKEIKDSEH